jgi:rod shape-determining protein MreD
VSTRRDNRRWPIYLSLFAALMLTIMPVRPEIAVWNADWVAMALIFWALATPARVGLGTAWVAGLLLDVLKGAVLGQHALALTLMCYPLMRFHLRIRVFPLPQQCFTVAWLLLFYHFALFWIDGILGKPVGQAARWFPVITSTLLWPLVFEALKRLRRRAAMN